MSIGKAIINYFDLNRGAREARRDDLASYSDKELLEEVERRGIIPNEIALNAKIDMVVRDRK